MSCPEALVTRVAALAAVWLTTIAFATQWRFETETTGWRPRADTIALTRVAEPGARADSQAYLRVAGTISGGWNYALSDTHPMAAGKYYRLTAWVRVRTLGETTLAPFLKCEFVASDQSQTLGRANTSRYDVEEMVTWQQLEGLFQAPQDTVRGWLALEKGGNHSMSIDADLDDVRIEEVARTELYRDYALEPVPLPLDAARGKHPRLYLDRARVEALCQTIHTTHAQLWQELKGRAASAAARKPPAYREDDGRSGHEQLWQRGVGNTMPLLALAYLVSADTKYLNAARDWALASCSYRTWGLGTTDGMDLAAGHQLFGLALVYDWCYDALDAETRETIRATLIRRTTAMFEAAASGRAWWRRSVLQNHLWVNITGMAAAGLALFDEVEDARFWVGLPLQKYRTTMDALGDDGASHEGAGYWQYGVEYMMKFMVLAADLLGEDMYDHPWWRNTAAYCQHVMLPRNAWTRRSCLVDIADCPRGNWYGPEYLLRGLARRFADGHAQWLAHEIDAADIEAASAPWLNLIWYDPSVAAVRPDGVPTLRHFEDMGLVAARSDWSGDEALLVFKCGPFIGHKAVAEFAYDPGGGHVHPDANHFVLFAHGEWLLRDDGYRSKWTGQHNTLLIDGKGQMGEGKMWFQGSIPLTHRARPRILRTRSEPTVDTIAADAAQAYPSELGLRQFVRHILFIKPNVLVVADDIVLADERPLELRFHPEQDEAHRDGSAFLVHGRNSTLRIEPLTTDGVEVTAESLEGQDRKQGKTFQMFTVRLATTASVWRNAVAFSWAPRDQQPAQVTMTQDASKWEFSVAGQRVALDLDASGPAE